MQRLRRLSRSGWILIGLLAGAIVVPAVTVAAAATIVHIEGGGHQATVSAGNQLRVVEMDPKFYTHIRGSAGNLSCPDLGTASATRAFVIKRISISAYNGPSSGSTSSVNVGAGSSCGAARTLADAQFSETGTHEVDLGDGVAVPAGTHLWLSVNGSNSLANIYGYTIGADAVPVTTAAVRRLGPEGAHRAH